MGVAAASYLLIFCGVGKGLRTTSFHSGARVLLLLPAARSERRGRTGEGRRSCCLRGDASVSIMTSYLDSIAIAKARYASAVK